MYFSAEWKTFYFECFGFFKLSTHIYVVGQQVYSTYNFLEILNTLYTSISLELRYSVIQYENLKSFSKIQ